MNGNEPMSTSATSARAAVLFAGHHRDLIVRTDRMFGILFVLQWVASVLIAALISPRTWEGMVSSTHIHLWAAVLLGGIITAFPLLLIAKRSGRVSTRHVIAVSQMLMSALLIHLTGGRIETHFHVFGSLAFLAFYRDRSVLTSAAVVVVIDHLIRGIFWPESVYGVLTATVWRSFEHVGWVVFELTFLFVAIRQGIREMWGIAHRQAEMESAHERTEQEVLERTSALRQAEARTRAIVETAANGIITFDDAGTLLTFNPAAEEIFCYEAGEVIGGAASVLVASSDGDSDDGFVEDYLTTAEMRASGICREVLGRRKDGTTFPLEMAVSKNHGGVFTGVVRDITERKAIDRMKTEFISTVSHELRTPLTSISGALGLLGNDLAGRLPDKASSLVEIALKNSNRLARMVNDILDIEKIESGNMEFRLESQDLTGIVEEAITANSAYAGERDVEIVLKYAIPDAIVRADRDRILQVLTNLLSNAAKFSPPGETIEVSVIRDGSRIHVEVSDRGPGVPVKFWSRIFDKFAQADSSDNRRKDGTGLGLNISKAIVEQHGGDIGFRTEQGVGSVFHFELPAMPRSRERIPSPDEFSTRLSGYRILVCEDDVDVANLLSVLLRRAGLKVDVAHDGEQVHVRLAAQHYDAMTLDLNLPDVDGLQLLRDLRRTPSTSKMPIVVVSATASQGREDVVHEALGVIDWIAKPIDPEQLLAAVTVAIRAGSPQNEADRTACILHVEDDDDLAHIVAETLSSVAELTQARTLDEARQLLAVRDFDILLLDLVLPDGSGLDLIPLLNPPRESVPVVIFSAHEPRTEVRDEVAASFVKSRTSGPQLAETITSLIRRAGVRPSVQSLESS